MEKNVIITISRQFGSNGREIARKLAEYLDIIINKFWRKLQ